VKRSPNCPGLPLDHQTLGEAPPRGPEGLRQGAQELGEERDADRVSVGGRCRSGCGCYGHVRPPPDLSYLLGRAQFALLTSTS
jgi:hypothetical protein